MKNLLFRAIPLLLGLAVAPTLKAQPLLESRTCTNRLFTDTRYSIDDAYEWVHSAPLSNGNLAVLAHHVDNGDVDIKLVVLTNTGTVVWEKTLDNSNYDYGIKVLVDGSDNIYAIGTTHFMASDQDLMVVKYNSSGVHQFTTYWDSGSNLGDVPVDAILGAGGNLYITGIANRSTESITSDEDYFTLRMSNGGNVDWGEVYDHANLTDIPVGLAANSQYVFVTGSTYTNSTNRQTTTLKYQMATGVMTQLALKNSTNNEYATHITLDADDNVYITGRSHNGQRFDAWLAKYTEDFYKIWDLNFDGFGRDDQGLFCRLNDNTVYMAAEGKNTFGDQCAYLLTCDTAGSPDDTLIWQPNKTEGTYTPADLLFNDDFVHLMLNVHESGQNPEAHVLTLTSTLALKHQYNFTYDEGAALRTAHFTSTGLYLSGVSYDDNDNVTTLTQYLEYLHIAEEYDDDTLNGDSLKLLQNGLMVSLNKREVLTTYLSNTGYEFGKPSKFLSATAVTTLETRFGLDEDSFWLVKSYPFLTMADTMVTSPAGRQFRTHNGYCRFEFYFPASHGPHNAMANASNSLPFNMASYVPKPQLANSPPNDPFLPKYQFSHDENRNAAKWIKLNLDGNVSSDILEAWDVLNYYGDADVLVGVVEGHPAPFHEDFIDGNQHIFNAFVNDDGITINRGQVVPTEHATKMTGHIAALTNNGKGVAGIAGGFGQPGVKISAYSNTIKGFKHSARDGVPITNHSYGFSGFDFFSPSDDDLLDAYNGGMTIIAGRGNNGDDGFHYPSTAFPFVISVGAYGMNGNYRYRLNDDPNKITWVTKKGYDSYGKDMDLLGPGCTALTFGPSINGNNTKNFYLEGNESSSATAHITGVAALLYGYTRNPLNKADNLYPEDIETLLELGAYDLTMDDLGPSESDTINADGANRPMPEVGYDDLTGWGRLDAGNSARYLEKSSHKILHFLETGVTITQVDGFQPEFYNDTVSFGEDLKESNTIQYVADRYKLTFTVEFSLPTAHQHWRIVNIARYPGQGIWPLPQESNLLGLPNADGYVTSALRHLKLDSIIDSSTIQLSGYTYKLKKVELSGGSFGQLASPEWKPFSTLQPKIDVRLGFSVHLYNDSFAKAPAPTSAGFSLYPNPAQNRVMVELPFAEEIHHLRLIDLAGRTIISRNNLGHIKQSSILLHQCSPGPYVVEMSTSEGIYRKKLMVE